MKISRRKAERETAAPPAPKPPGNGRRRAGNQRGRFVMVLGDDGAILVYMQGNTVVRRLFAPSPQPDHTAGIIELMRSQPSVPLSILVDVLDQQYVRHSFPPVSALSVSGLVRRRLDRDFQADDLKGSLPLGRDKTGRKEWNFLLIALANTELMQQWIELIIELPNELKGLYLVPVEARRYMEALKKKLGGAVLPWQLLVTHNKVSGFRQVVLREGRLVFTRVTQAIDDGVAAVVAGNIEQEIINTLEYLRRLGFQSAAEIELTVIAGQEVKDTLDLNRFQAGAAHVLSPLDVADMFTLQQAALHADRFGDVVMAAWFGHAGKTTLRFLTAYGERLAKLYLLRRALLAGGVLLALVLLGLSAAKVAGMMRAAAEAGRFEQQRRPLAAQVRTVKDSLEGLDKNVAFKTAVVNVYDAYIKTAHTPLQFVEQLAPLLPAEIRVLKYSWSQQAAGESGAPPAPAEGPLEIKVELEFTGHYQDVETLTNAVDRSIAELKEKMPDYTISAGTYPWLAGNTNSLEISFDRKQNGPLREGGNKVELTFHGPKAAGAPVGAPPGGMDPLMGGMP